MSYPVSVQIDYTEKRNRLTSFFRMLLAIPVAIAAFVYAIGGLVVTIIAWFALLFTGRWPEGLYKFITSYLRFSLRYSAFYYLLVDAYPPFDLGDHDEYPARVNFTPREEPYSRLLVFFRGLYVIPAEIIAYVLAIVLSIAAIVNWLVILVLGRLPKGLQDLGVFCVTYLIRANALILLVTQDYPPFSAE